MKKTFGLFLMLFTLMLASCGGEASIASTLMVIEKGYSSDNKEHWIKAYDPNNQNKKEALKYGGYKKRWFGTLLRKIMSISPCIQKKELILRF